VPANPLSATGLSTPYQLTGPNGMTPQQSGCTMANFAALGAFVQATILNPATGALSTYEPLVITQGTQPAAAPVVPRLPAGAVVTVDFGFNGTNLTLAGTGGSLQQGNCVNGLNGSIFGQVAFCNGTQFFQAVNRAEARGMLKVPAAGTSAKTGSPCLTTRSFEMIDQDQSDNVTSTYLLNANGQTAQDNTANEAAVAGAQKINNGSDNLLLDAFIDPVTGCTPMEAPDLTNAGTMGTSQALDEIMAAKNATAPVALVPENDEMVSIAKTNVYRSLVDQPMLSAHTNPAAVAAAYCQNMVNVQTPYLAKNQTLLTGGPTPVPGTGNNLFTFLANRLSMSFTNLGCQNFGLKNPVAVTLDGNGAATAATLNTTQQKVTNTTGTPPPTAMPTGVATGGATGGATASAAPSTGATKAPPRVHHRRGRRHHRLMNPSGE
jgi:hypothetical protein